MSGLCYLFNSEDLYDSVSVRGLKGIPSAGAAEEMRLTKVRTVFPRGHNKNSFRSYLERAAAKYRASFFVPVQCFVSARGKERIEVDLYC